MGPNSSLSNGQTMPSIHC